MHLRSDIGYEGDINTTEVAHDDGHYDDEEYLFRVDHYFGATSLTFKISDKGWFGRTPMGAAELLSSDIIREQMLLLRSLGVECRTNDSGHLAINTAQHASTATWDDVDAEPKTHPLYRGWYQPGVSPTVQVRACCNSHSECAGQHRTPPLPLILPTRRIAL